MASWPEAGWEHLPWYDEGGGVGPEVREEVGDGENEDEEQGWSIEDLVEEESQHKEQNCQYAESHDLDLDTSPWVDEKNCHPVPWYSPQ